MVRNSRSVDCKLSTGLTYFQGWPLRHKFSAHIRGALIHRLRHNRHATTDAPSRRRTGATKQARRRPRHRNVRPHNRHPAGARAVRHGNELRDVARDLLDVCRSASHDRGAAVGVHAALPVDEPGRPELLLHPVLGVPHADAPRRAGAGVPDRLLHQPHLHVVLDHADVPAVERAVRLRAAAHWPVRADRHLRHAVRAGVLAAGDGSLRAAVLGGGGRADVPGGHRGWHVCRHLLRRGSRRSGFPARRGHAGCRCREPLRYLRYRAEGPQPR